MKKQAKSALDAKQANQAAMKLQKEKMESRSITIFATALGAEMILIYLYNWFQTNSSLLHIAGPAAHILMIVFFALMVFTAVKGILLKKADQKERSQKYWNWFFVCLAALLGTFYVWPGEVLAHVFNVDPMNLAKFNSYAPIFSDNPVQFRAALLMCGVGIYAVASLIYYGVKSAMLGKKIK